MGHVLQPLGSDIFLIASLWEPSLCSHVIEVADCCEFLSPPPGSSLIGEPRSNEVLPLSEPTSLLESTIQLLIPNLATVRDLLGKHYEVTFSHLEMYAIERFRPGQTHKRHHDGLLLANRYAELDQGLPARDVGVIGFLNHDFEGGDLLFNRQSIKVKPSTGGVVVFPAHYTHPYQALPVLKGCKYTVTSWLFH